MLRNHRRTGVWDGDGSFGPSTPPFSAETMAPGEIALLL